MRSLLKLLQVDDIFCHRAVLLLWLLMRSPQEIQSVSPNGQKLDLHLKFISRILTTLHSCAELDRGSGASVLVRVLLWSSLLLREGEVGRIVEKTADYRSDSKSNVTTGTVTCVRGNDLEVLWGQSC